MYCLSPHTGWRAVYPGVRLTPHPSRVRAAPPVEPLPTPEYSIDSDSVYGGALSVGPSDDCEFTTRIEITRNPGRDGLPTDVVDSYSLTPRQTEELVKVLSRLLGWTP
jgi:hypothetical protein